MTIKDFFCWRGSLRARHELASHGGGLGQHTSGMTAAFGGGRVDEDTSYTDTGGASRFFLTVDNDEPDTDGAA